MNAAMSSASFFPIGRFGIVACGSSKKLEISSELIPGFAAINSNGFACLGFETDMLSA
jgi:hypothetical protein